MILNRFTSIDSMYSIVNEKRIRLSNPKKWEDKNDAEAIEAYRKKKKLKKVLALCFTDDYETIYHWSVVSEKNNICCIEFDGDKLLEIIDNKKGYRFGKVDYIRINELQEKLTTIDDIPFCKRYSYRNESEYRILYESNYPITNKYIPINLEIIRKITINQNLSYDVFRLIKAEIEDNDGVKINRSTIYKNTRWLNHINRIKKQ